MHRECSLGESVPRDLCLPCSDVLSYRFVEASVSPGFIAVTRLWYTKQEQPIRLGIW